MRIEFIGTGNSNNTPMPGCGCSVCREAKFNLERRRRAPSFAVSTSDESETLVLDAGDPAVTAWLDRPQTTAVLLSHFHPGHYHALLGYRPHHDVTQLFCPPDRKGQESLGSASKGYLINELHPFTPITFGSFTITPVLLNHSVITFGYCIEADSKRLGYLCDTCGLPPQTESFLSDWKPDVLIIDCNQHPNSPKPNHNTPKQALKIHRQTGAAQSFLAHISCSSGKWLNPKPKSFPSNVDVSRDGMVIDLCNPASMKNAKRVLI
ncbi:MAG: phosphoribosyl 1,2-cyclic phosphate phosphodiesterase [Verrucomicrobiales bacterium]|jgi:phosphoribosyl 1,2-cyclic phosphate phosphodiesterase